MQTLLVGIGLLFGLSAALVEWANHIATEPATAYVLVFPVLLLLAARSVPPTVPDRRAGLLWMAAAMSVEILAMGGGVERFARMAIPLGIVGLLRFNGSAALAPAILAVFVIPLPRVLTAIVPLEEVWRAFAELALGAAGPALELNAWDSGLRLVTLFAGLGWYAEARKGGGWRDAFRHGVRLAVLGLPTQLAAVVLAVAIAQAGAGGFARAFLTHGLWMACAVAMVVVPELTRKEEIPSRV